MSNRITETKSQDSNISTGHMSLARLTPDELAPLVDSIPDSRPAAKRLVEYLATNPHAPTVNVNKAVAVGNISQEATAANKKLFGKGYMLGCMRPPVPLKNRFEQETAQHLWSLYKLPKEAANDSEY
jgi:hypothetical protein